MRFRVAAGVFAGLSAVFVAAGFRADAQPVPPPPPAAAESLDGAWQVVSLIEDGHLAPPSAVREHFLKDGRLVVKGNTIHLHRPGSDAAREIAFVTDPSKSPKTIDLAGTEKVGPRGIYLRDGDTLMLALGGPGSMDRPTEFSSAPGSNRVVLTLTKVPDRAAPDLPAPVPPPKPAPDADAVLAKQLAGTWGFQDDDKVVYNTLNPDGTFSTSQSWKRGFKRVFHEDVRTSGTWKAENGSLVTRVTASTEKSQMGQIYSTKVYSIDAREIVLLDDAGRFRREWKVR